MNISSKILNGFGRVSLALIYVWFGALKIVGQSPASPLVGELQAATIPFISFSTFILLFGFFEVLIGLMFLFPRISKITFWIFAFHMLTTTLPLVILPGAVWTGFLAPTLEGQYIIKNLALIGL